VDMAALEGWAVQVPDVSNSSAFQFPEEAGREGIRSVLCAPLLVRGRALGVLRLYSAESRTFTADEETFLTALASQGAIAIDNACAFRRLEELESAKSRFVFQVAHEVKSPLAAVQQMLFLLDSGSAGALEARHREIVGRCTARAADLQATVDDLLALGSLRGRVSECRASPVALGEVIGRVRERVAALVEEKHLELCIRCDGDGPVVQAEPGNLRKLLGNLLENAVKYTPAGGSVSLSAERQGDRVVVVCRDSGIGIPPDALPHLFEEFYRASNAKKSHSGTGLGLALVKRIVDLYRGEVRVESVEGRGSTFTILLPAG